MPHRDLTPSPRLDLRGGGWCHRAEQPEVLDDGEHHLRGGSRDRPCSLRRPPKRPGAGPLRSSPTRTPGKTTLTEKLLLYGGAIQLAGSVAPRKASAPRTSDWMALEQERGISVSSTVLQFPYRDCRFNLLDTPGHQDFSEDTYRTLTAVDSAVMVIDAARGIEEQTKKLFEVCRQRGIPIFTFINKLDRPAREPLELLDEIEQVLGIGATPMNWPIGNGSDFRGVYDRTAQQVHLFDRTEHGQHRAPVEVANPSDPALRQLLGEQLQAPARLRDRAARGCRRAVRHRSGGRVASRRRSSLGAP